MKMLRNLLFTIGFCTSFGVSAQTCFGDYTTQANGTTIDFMGTVTLNVTHIVWDFGDGNFDFTNTINTTHTYAGPGTYQACIQVYDSLNACADSTCHMIVIDSCYGSFSYSVNGLTVNFYGYANGATPNTVYAWNFGDASSSSNQNPSHTYAANGTYTVCFAYYDLISGCADSLCLPVVVGGCQADFTSIDSLGYVFFISNSTVGNTGNYMWDFGDGNYSTQQNPSNTYSTAGTYQVCLATYDSLWNFCDSTCHYITVTNVAGVEDHFIGISSVSISPNPGDDNATVSFIMFRTGEAEISVYDISGRRIVIYDNEQFMAGKQAKKINTSEMSNGTYFVVINSQGFISNAKMIVSHKQ